MNGQWIGNYSGSSIGTIIINIDEMPIHYQGMGYLFEDDSMLPGTAASFRTKNKDVRFKFRTTEAHPINPDTGYADSWDNVKKLYPSDVNFAKYADVEGSWNSKSLSLSWKNDGGGWGHCKLNRSKAGKDSELVAKEENWDSYKEYVAGLEGSRLLFRGQNKPWRLRTSFHRTGRAELIRYLDEDIQQLHRQLSARTNHVFNLDIANENGAFFNLIQHHGYPTPLLDWTYSPYVAAFFAYRGISRQEAEKAKPKDKVRILVFDQARWKLDLPQLLVLTNAGLHLSVVEFLAIENERMIPQQAASTVTNIDDIESYIRSYESKDRIYLSAIDLPVSDREQVVQELSYMGITAGSMFPGLDGACEELKERNFEI